MAIKENCFVTSLVRISNELFGAALFNGCIKVFRMGSSSPNYELKGH